MDREWYKAQQYERLELQGFRLYPENLEAYELFDNLFTQRVYRQVGNGDLLQGMNYPGIWSVLDRRYSKKKAKNLFEELQLIERGMVLKANEQNKLSS